MRLPELRDRLEEECEFPAGAERVASLFDGVRLEAPNGEPVELSTVLDRAEGTRYHSLQEAYDTVLANLDGRYVGRRRYDDRSRTHTREEELSF